MIKFIFLLTPFIFVIFSLCIRKRRKSISFEINHGVKCYSCKEDLEENVILLKYKEDIKICKVCNREEKFNIINNKLNINRIKRFLLSKYHSNVINCIYIYRCYFKLPI